MSLGLGKWECELMKLTVNSGMKVMSRNWDHQASTPLQTGSTLIGINLPLGSAWAQAGPQTGESRLSCGFLAGKLENYKAPGYPCLVRSEHHPGI